MIAITRVTVVTAHRRNHRQEEHLGDPIGHMTIQLRRTWGVVAALGAAIVVFAAVGLAVTATLDPYVWPSALLGLPAGAVAATIAFLLVRRLGQSPAPTT